MPIWKMLRSKVFLGLSILPEALFLLLKLPFLRELGICLCRFALIGQAVRVIRCALILIRARSLKHPLRSPQMPHRVLKVLSGMNFILKVITFFSTLKRACLFELRREL